MYCFFMYKGTMTLILFRLNLLARTLCRKKKKKKKVRQATTVLILETHKKNQNLPDKKLRDGVSRPDKAFATSWSSEYFRVPG